MRLMGLDPGLRNTGWGIIEVNDNRLRYIADGVVHSDQALSLAERLCQLHAGITQVIMDFLPGEAAIEEIFVNVNPVSTIKLCQARGAVIIAPAEMGIMVAEYAPNQIKKAVVGTGHAEKAQIDAMVRMLLPGCKPKTVDSADALAVAICHAHFRKSKF